MASSQLLRIQYFLYIVSRVCQPRDTLNAEPTNVATLRTRSSDVRPSVIGCLARTASVPWYPVPPPGPVGPIIGAALGSESARQKRIFPTGSGSPKSTIANPLCHCVMPSPVTSFAAFSGNGLWSRTNRSERQHESTGLVPLSLRHLTRRLGGPSHQDCSRSIRQALSANCCSPIL